ncbi:MAG: IMPACT family protein [Betaproteobacteria bacterium]
MGTYRTVARPATAELKLEKSRFISYAAPTLNAAEAQAMISRLRQEHRQATHVCFAYRVGDEPQTVTCFADHGEPAGTAGKPILGAILRRDLTDVTVVVVRYFGGKKLGVRGLIQAYGQAAEEALEAAGISVQQRMQTLRVACSYAQLPAVAHLARQTGGQAGAPEYDARRVTVEVRVPLEALPAFRTAVAALGAELGE